MRSQATHKSQVRYKIPAKSRRNFGLTVDPDELFAQGADQHKAAAICRRCPVVYQCAAEALDNKVEFGVWGGMTECERRAMLKKHPEVVSWSALFDELKTRNVSLK